MEEKVIIILKDGTRIECILNGNIFISSKNIKRKLSIENLSEVTYEFEEYKKRYNDLQLSKYWKENDGYRLILTSISPEQKMIMELESKLAIAIESTADLTDMVLEIGRAHV